MSDLEGSAMRVVVTAERTCRAAASPILMGGHIRTVPNTCWDVWIRMLRGMIHNQGLPRLTLENRSPRKVVIMRVITMQDLRQLGGGAGILAGIAAAWLLVGATVVLPAAGLSLTAQENPQAYLTFAAKHQVMLWMVNVLGGLLVPLLALVLLLALADRFQTDAPARSQIGLAIGVVGAAGFAIGAFLKQIGLGSLITLYTTNKAAAAAAFYALNGAANSFLSLGDVALGLGALVFGSIMLRAGGYYGHVGFLSSITGMPLILSGFVPHIILYLMTSVLTIAWLAWTGTLMWMETAPLGAARKGSARDSQEQHLKVMGREAQ